MPCRPPPPTEQCIGSLYKQCEYPCSVTVRVPAAPTPGMDVAAPDAAVAAKNAVAAAVVAVEAATEAVAAATEAIVSVAEAVSAPAQAISCEPLCIPRTGAARRGVPAGSGSGSGSGGSSSSGKTHKRLLKMLVPQRARLAGAAGA